MRSNRPWVTTFAASGMGLTIEAMGFPGVAGRTIVRRQRAVAITFGMRRSGIMIRAGQVRKMAGLKVWMIRIVETWKTKMSVGSGSLHTSSFAFVIGDLVGLGGCWGC